jgi:multidrug resistance efflux pump
MRNTTETIDYWRYKLQTSEKTVDELKAKVHTLEQQLCTQKMRMSLEKCTIFDQLQSSYGEVSQLHQVVYKDKAHKACTAAVDLVHIGVLAVPDMVDGYTHFVKGGAGEWAVRAN